MLRAKLQVPEIDDQGRERIAGSHLVSLTFEAFSRLYDCDAHASWDLRVVTPSWCTYKDEIGRRQ